MSHIDFLYFLLSYIQIVKFNFLFKFLQKISRYRRR